MSSLIAELLNAKKQAVADKVAAINPNQQAVDVARQLSTTGVDPTNTYINPNIGTTIGDRALIEADNIVRQREAMGLAPVGQAGITDYLAQGVNQLSNIPRALGATLTGDAFGLETSYENKIARDRKLSSFDTTREDQLQAEVAEASAKAKQAWDQGNKFDAAVSYLAGVGKAGVNNPLAVGGMALLEAPTLAAQAVSILNPVTGAAMIGGTLNDLARQKYGEARDAQIAAKGGYRPLTDTERLQTAVTSTGAAGLETLGQVVAGKLGGDAVKGSVSTLMNKLTGSGAESLALRGAKGVASTLGVATSEGVTEGGSQLLNTYGAKTAIGQELTDKDYVEALTAGGMGALVGGALQGGVSATAGALPASIDIGKKAVEFVADRFGKDATEPVGTKVDAKTLIDAYPLTEEQKKLFSVDGVNTLSSKVSSEITSSVDKVNNLLDSLVKSKVKPEDTPALLDNIAAQIKSLMDVAKKAGDTDTDVNGYVAATAANTLGEAFSEVLTGLDENTLNKFKELVAERRQKQAAEASTDVSEDVITPTFGDISVESKDTAETLIDDAITTATANKETKQVEAEALDLKQAKESTSGTMDLNDDPVLTAKRDLIGAGDDFTVNILDQADNLFYKAEVLASKGYSNKQLIKAVETIVKKLDTVATDTESNLYTATQALKAKLEQFKSTGLSEGKVVKNPMYTGEFANIKTILKDGFNVEFDSDKTAEEVATVGLNPEFIDRKDKRSTAVKKVVPSSNMNATANVNQALLGNVPSTIKAIEEAKTTIEVGNIIKSLAEDTGLINYKAWKELRKGDRNTFVAATTQAVNLLKKVTDTLANQEGISDDVKAKLKAVSEAATNELKRTATKQNAFKPRTKNTKVTPVTSTSSTFTDKNGLDTQELLTDPEAYYKAVKESAELDSNDATKQAVSVFHTVMTKLSKGFDRYTQDVAAKSKNTDMAKSIAKAKDTLDLLNNFLKNNLLGATVLPPEIAEAATTALFDLIAIRSTDNVSLGSAIGIADPLNNQDKVIAVKKATPGLHGSFLTKAKFAKDLGNSVITSLGTKFDTNEITPRQKEELVTVLGDMLLKLAVDVGLLQAITIKQEALAKGGVTNSKGIDGYQLPSKAAYFTKGTAETLDKLISHLIPENRYINRPRITPVNEKAKVKYKNYGSTVDDGYNGLREKAVKKLRTLAYNIDRKAAESFRSKIKDETSRNLFVLNQLYTNKKNNFASALNFLNSTPDSIKSAVIEALRKYAVGQETSLDKDLINAWVQKDYVDSMSQAIAGIDLEIQNLDDFLLADSMTEGDTNYYFDWFIAVQGRLHLQSSTVNPQNSSIHKAVLKVKVPLVDPRDPDQLETIVEGLAAIHYGVDEKTELSSKQQAINNVKGNIRSIGRVDAYSLISSNNPNKEFLIEAYTAISQGKKFDWKPLIENDAVTSGAAINNIIYGGDIDKLKKFGVFTDGIESFNEMRESDSDFKDTYVSLLDSDDPAVLEVINNSVEDLGLSKKDLRNIVKKPSQAQGYSAQKDTVVRGLVEGLVKAAKDATLSRIYQTVSSAIESGTPVVQDAYINDKNLVNGRINVGNAINSGLIQNIIPAIKFDDKYINETANKLAEVIYSNMLESVEDIQPQITANNTITALHVAATESAVEDIANNPDTLKLFGIDKKAGSIAAYKAVREMIKENGGRSLFVDNETELSKDRAQYFDTQGSAGLSSIQVAMKYVSATMSGIAAKLAHSFDSRIIAEAVIESGGLALITHDAIDGNPVQVKAMGQAANKAFIEATINSNVLQDSKERAENLINFLKSKQYLVTDSGSLGDGLSALIAKGQQKNLPVVNDIFRSQNFLDATLVETRVKKVNGKTVNYKAVKGFRRVKNETGTATETVVDTSVLAQAINMFVNDSLDKGIQHIEDTHKAILDSTDIINVNNYAGPMSATAKVKTSKLANSVNRDSVVKANEVTGEVLQGNNPEVSAKNMKALLASASKTEVTAENVGTTYGVLAATDNVNLSTEDNSNLLNVLDAVIKPMLDSGVTLTVEQSEANIRSNLGSSTGNRIGLVKSTLGTIKQSIREVFVHEALHSALRNALDNNSKYYNAVKNLIDSVKADPRYNTLDKLAGIFKPMGLTDKEAKDLANYVFNNNTFLTNQSTTQDVHEFMSYGLTNPHLVKVLKTIKPLDAKEKGVQIMPGDSIFSRTVNKIYNLLTDVLSGSKTYAKGSNVHEAALNIAKDIVALKDNRLNIIERGLNSIDEAVKSGLDKSFVDLFKKFNQKQFKDTLEPEAKKTAVAAIAILRVNLYREDKDTVMQELNSKMVTVGDMFRLAGETLNIDDNSSIGITLDRMINDPEKEIKGLQLLHRKYKSVVERYRNSVKQGVVDSLQRAFSTPPTSDESKGMTKGLVMTDVSSLYDSYGLDAHSKVSTMLFNENVRKAEIKRLEAKFSGKGALSTMVLTQAKGLGNYMITRVTNVPNQVRNTHNILKGSFAGPKAKADIGKAFPYDTYYKDLDALISLYAIDTLNYKDKSSLQALQRVWDREFSVNKDSNGVTETVAQIGANIKLSMEKNFKGPNKALMQKGYHATSYSKDADYAIVNVNRRKEFEQQGYKVVEEGIINDQVGGSKVFMIRPTAHTSRILAGALGSQSEHRSGTSFYEAMSENDPNLTPNQIYSMMDKVKSQLTSAAQSGKVMGERVYPIPVFNTLGEVVDYSYTLSEEQQERMLGKDYDVFRALGDAASTIESKYEANIISNEVLNSLLSISTKLPANQLDWITPDTDEYKRLPSSIKYKADLMFKGKGIPVPRGYTRHMFSTEKFTLADTKPIMALQRMYPDTPIRFWITAAERIMEHITRQAKTNIVVGTFAVVYDNILSNIALVAMKGVPITQVVPLMIEGIKFIHEFEKHERELAALQGKLARTPANLQQPIKDEIAKYQSLLKSNPATKLVEAGVYTSITDDINLDQYDYISGLMDSAQAKMPSKIKAITESKAGSIAQTAFNYAYITKDTPIFKLMSNANRYLDFAGRYAIIQHEFKKNKANGTTANLDEVYINAINTFINYDAPEGKGLEYLDRMGLTQFTRFFVGAQSVIRNLVVNSTSRTAVAVGVEMSDLGSKMPTVLDASVLIKNLTNMLRTPVQNFEEAVTPGIYRNFFS